jgi:hypothetical protein
MLALVYSVFGALCGWLEAVLYARRGAEAFTFNEHIGMMVQRVAALALLPATLLVYHWHGAWILAELMPMALLFPLVHDEAYNFTRLWLTQSEKYQAMATIPGSLNPDRAAWRAAWLLYQYGYQSPTTTARHDFTGAQRTWLAVIAAVGLVGLYVFPLHPFPLF